MLVNEDFPALATSPRNACLDGVESCDVCLVILGERAGHLAESGRTVVEEEYEGALRNGKPVLAFVQDGVRREARQEEFVERVSDYIGGRFRDSFQSEQELERKITEALRVLDVGTNEDYRTASERVTRILQDSLLRTYQQPVLRIGLVPVRNEEIVDIRRLGEERFADRLLEIGRSTRVELLEPRAGYEVRMSERGLEILHDSQSRFTSPQRIVGSRLTESGAVLIEANVTQLRTGGSRRARAESMDFVIAEEEVELQLRRVFAFASAIYDEVDPYERQQGFLYNLGLFRTGHRYLERNPQPRSSYGLRTLDPQDVLAHELPRRISRAQMRQPGEELEITMAGLRLQLSESR